MGEQLMNGRVAMVTGGGSGIGRASALAFARAGAQVVVSDVAVEAGNATVRAILSAGGAAIFQEADVANSDQVSALVDRTIQEFGRLDYAHNNGGIEGPVKPVIDLTEEEWDRVIDINLKGVWNCLRYQIPVMLEQGGGAIGSGLEFPAALVGLEVPGYLVELDAAIGSQVRAESPVDGRRIPAEIDLLLDQQPAVVRRAVEHFAGLEMRHVLQGVVAADHHLEHDLGWRLDAHRGANRAAALAGVQLGAHHDLPRGDAAGLVGREAEFAGRRVPAQAGAQERSKRRPLPRQSHA